MWKRYLYNLHWKCLQICRGLLSIPVSQKPTLYCHSSMCVSVSYLSCFDISANCNSVDYSCICLTEIEYLCEKLKMTLSAVSTDLHKGFGQQWQQSYFLWAYIWSLGVWGYASRHWDLACPGQGQGWTGKVELFYPWQRWSGEHADV